MCIIYIYIWWHAQVMFENICIGNMAFIGGFNGVDINLMIFPHHACIQPKKLGLIWWKNVFYRFVNGILIVMIMVLYRFNVICRDYSPRKTGLNGSDQWKDYIYYIYRDMDSLWLKPKIDVEIYWVPPWKCREFMTGGRIFNTMTGHGKSSSHGPWLLD